MAMDYSLQVNLREIERAVAAADVLVVGFSLFPERLLVDTRSTPLDPPLVRVVQPVSQVEERIRELRALRPHFGDPERFVFFVWPRRIGTFQALGVWDRILERVAPREHPTVAEQCQAALHELYLLEQQETVRALTGEGYRTLWERARG